MTGDELQQVIDRAKEQGCNQVTIPSGEYALRDSLRLRSGLRIVADGRVVLRMPTPQSSEILDIVGTGHSEIRVARPEMLAVGMGISIMAGNTGGFGVTVARIVDRCGETFFLDSPCQRDYRPGEKARVSTVFPAIAGYDVQDACVEGITVDGGNGTQACTDGCRNAGVYLLGCRNVMLDRLTVERYYGDAISFQQCVDIYVSRCAVHDNAGHGLHPGSGTVRYVLADNNLQRNGRCGIFYCLRTTHSECRNNLIECNGEEGISIGERDTDHLLSRNVIRGNGRAGLAFRNPQVESGDRVVVVGNQFALNGEKTGIPQVDVGHGLNDIRIESNTFEGQRRPAIRIADRCRRIVVVDNVCDGQAMASDDIETKSPINEVVGADWPPVGPGQLSMGGARHLRINRLSLWVDRTRSGQDAICTESRADRGVAT